MKVSVNIKMDEEVRDQAKDLFHQMGLDMTTAVNMFLIQAIREKAIPFQISTIDKQLYEEKLEQLIAEKINEANHKIENGKVRKFEEFAKEVSSKYDSKI